MMEIVFMPYKASMWDSLETIWEAAKADERCLVRVIPIPYYKKKDDGSFGELCYEGDLFPKNVPIDHYNDIDYDTLNVDVIYIHNPYDMGNKATSIAPEFYSMELKKHCNKLVYVPYYVTSGFMGEAQALCFSYIYVDYIIAQSESILPYFDASVPRRKLLPLGSPKLDRVINRCRETILPNEEWQEIARGRKVYFYNTSLNELLEYPKMYLKKMRYVFSCFKSQETACILWRPHPLFEQTLRSMVPEYLDEYIQIRDEFTREKYGIYDNAVDMDTALSFSDAYIGDRSSSLTALFGVSGKPLFLLDKSVVSDCNTINPQNIISNIEFGRLNPRWAVVYGNKLFRSDDNYDFRFFCDLTEEENGISNYAGVWEINGKSYVCPIISQDIIVLSDEGIERRIELKDNILFAPAFKRSLAIGSYIFLIPAEYPYLVIYDTESDTLDYIEEYGRNNNADATVMEDSLIVASASGSELLRINTATGDVDIVSTGVEVQGGCRRIYYYDGNIWFISKDGSQIIRMDIRQGINCVYSDIPERYVFSFVREKYVYLYNQYEKDYIKLSIDHGTFEKCENAFEQKVKIDLENLREHTKGYDHQDRWLPYACFENCCNTLPELLKYGPEYFGYDRDVQIKAFESIAKNIDGTSGKKIHEFVMDSISE